MARPRGLAGKPALGRVVAVGQDAGQQGQERLGFGGAVRIEQLLGLIDGDDDARSL